MTRDTEHSFMCFFELRPLKKLYSVHLPNPSQSNNQEKAIKGSLIGKEGVKLSLFADDMILHLKDPENSTKKSPRDHKYL
jgi:hypothetical protein